MSENRAGSFLDACKHGVSAFIEVNGVKFASRKSIFMHLKNDLGMDMAQLKERKEDINRIIMDVAKATVESGEKKTEEKAEERKTVKRKASLTEGKPKKKASSKKTSIAQLKKKTTPYYNDLKMLCSFKHIKIASLELSQKSRSEGIAAMKSALMNLGIDKASLQQVSLTETLQQAELEHEVAMLQSDALSVPAPRSTDAESDTGGDSGEEVVQKKRPRRRLIADLSDDE